MIDRVHLRDHQVVLRINGTSRAVGGTVVKVEDDCLWLSGGDVVARLTENLGGMPVGMKTPVVFVPFAQILWLIAAQEEIAA